MNLPPTRLLNSIPPALVGLLDAPITATTFGISANDVRLKAIGSTVKAFVNGKKVAEAKDADPTAVKGRKAEVFAGANKKNSVGAFGRVDDVRLAVPKP